MNNDKPLLGDHVEHIIKSIGGDKIAQRIEQATKKPCKCQQRKRNLNELHSRLRKRLSKEPNAK